MQFYYLCMVNYLMRAVHKQQPRSGERFGSRAAKGTAFESMAPVSFSPGISVPLIKPASMKLTGWDWQESYFVGRSL